MWFLYADGVVSFVTGGRKLENVRRNPRVALSVERADDDAVHWTVTLLGIAEVFDDERPSERFDERAVEKYWEPDGDDRYVEVTVGSATAERYSVDSI